MKLKRGFTLMELLIVIAIIGILMAVGVVSYSSVQKKSRDSRRRDDMKAIQNGFEQYYSDNNGLYPDSNNCTVDKTYLPGGLPADPKPVPYEQYQGLCYDTLSGDAPWFLYCAKLEDATGNATTPTLLGYETPDVNLPKQYFCVKSLQ